MMTPGGGGSGDHDHHGADAEHHHRQLMAERTGLFQQRQRLDELLPPGPDDAFADFEQMAELVEELTQLGPRV